MVQLLIIEFKYFFRYVFCGLFFIIISSFSASAQQTSGLTEKIVSNIPVSEADFPVVSIQKIVAQIRYDETDFKGVIRAIGDLRRLPDIATKKHKGGDGIYYHVDLHGAPHAYQWLNMTQILHMWKQLQLTYSYGVNKVWILNVGDLKPNEYPMDFFLQMAWNPTSFYNDNLDDYAIQFKIF